MVNEKGPFEEDTKNFGLEHKAILTLGTLHPDISYSKLNEHQQSELMEFCLGRSIVETGTYCERDTSQDLLARVPLELRANLLPLRNEPEVISVYFKPFVRNDQMLVVFRVITPDLIKRLEAQGLSSRAEKQALDEASKSYFLVPWQIERWLAVKYYPGVPKTYFPPESFFKENFPFNLERMAYVEVLNITWEPVLAEARKREKQDAMYSTT